MLAQFCGNVDLYVCGSGSRTHTVEAFTFDADTILTSEMTCEHDSPAPTPNVFVFASHPHQHVVGSCRPRRVQDITSLHELFVKCVGCKDAPSCCPLPRLPLRPQSRLLISPSAAPRPLFCCQCHGCDRGRMRSRLNIAVPFRGRCTCCRCHGCDRGRSHGRILLSIAAAVAAAAVAAGPNCDRGRSHGRLVFSIAAAVAAVTAAAAAAVTAGAIVASGSHRCQILLFSAGVMNVVVTVAATTASVIVIVRPPRLRPRPQSLSHRGLHCILQRPLQ
jgi:hypothetical protein